MRDAHDLGQASPVRVVRPDRISASPHLRVSGLRISVATRSRGHGHPVTARFEESGLELRWLRPPEAVARPVASPPTCDRAHRQRCSIEIERHPRWVKFGRSWRVRPEFIVSVPAGRSSRRPRDRPAAHGPTRRSRYLIVRTAGSTRSVSTGGRRSPRRPDPFGRRPSPAPAEFRGPHPRPTPPSLVAASAKSADLRRGGGGDGACLVVGCRSIVAGSDRRGGEWCARCSSPIAFPRSARPDCWTP